VNVDSGLELRQTPHELQVEVNIYHAEKVLQIACINRIDAAPKGVAIGVGLLQNKREQSTLSNISKVYPFVVTII